MDDLIFMQAALAEARLSLQEDEIPVGCVIVKDNKIIAQAHNQKQKYKNSQYHAEMIALFQATKALNDWRLQDCDVYVTLEPCLMCCGALIQARVRRVIYGAYDPKVGAVESIINTFDIKGLNHQILYLGGILKEESSSLLKQYFKHKRDENHLDL